MSLTPDELAMVVAKAYRDGYNAGYREGHKAGLVKQPYVDYGQRIGNGHWQGNYEAQR